MLLDVVVAPDVVVDAVPHGVVAAVLLDVVLLHVVDAAVLLDIVVELPDDVVWLWQDLGKLPQQKRLY